MNHVLSSMTGLRARVMAIAATAAVAVASAAAGNASAQAHAAVALTLKGLSSSQCGQCSPADVQVAAGPKDLVEMVNVSIRVWTLGGGSPAPRLTEPLGSFYSTNGGGSVIDRRKDNLFDPRVLYDRSSGRWFASITDETRREVDLAVSDGGDPLGGWRIYGWDERSGCPDFPALGVSQNVVVLTMNVYAGSCDGRLAGAKAIIASKQDLMAGVGFADLHYTTVGPDPRFESLSPAQSATPSNDEILVGTDERNSAVQLLSFSSWNPGWPGNLCPAGTAIPVGHIDPLPPILQRGSRKPVDGRADSRVETAGVLQNGVLSLAVNDGCVPYGDRAERSCVRVIQIQTSTQSVLTDAPIAFAGGYAYHPALYPDAAGDLVIVYGFSSKTAFPSVRYSLKPAGGVFGPSSTIVRGTAPNTSGVFGDYFGAAADPSMPSRIWVGGEFSNAQGGSTEGWGTTVSAIDTSGTPSTTPTTPVGPMPSAGKYCGFNDQGKGVCLDVSASGQVTSFRSESVVNCTPASTGSWTLSFTDTAVPILANFSFAYSFSGPLVSYTPGLTNIQASYEISGVFDLLGNVSGTIDLKSISFDAASRHIDCSSAQYAWKARRQG